MIRLALLTALFGISSTLLTGCCGHCYQPICSDRNADGSVRDSCGPMSDTKSVTTPIATIIATRNGTVWNASVIATKTDSYGAVQDTTPYQNNRSGFGTLRFSAQDDMRQVVVPVTDGAVTITYARMGWAQSELRIVVTDAKASVIHTETLR